MSLCVKCPDVSSKDILICSGCKKGYHPSCTQIISIDNFKKLSVRKKASWRCDVCAVSMPSPTEDRSESSIVLEHMKSMQDALTEQIKGVNLNVEGVKSELVTVRDTIGAMQSKLDSLMRENEERKKELCTVVEENNQLRGGMLRMEDRVRQLEQYSRRDNLEIVGVPLTRGEDILALLEKIAKVIDVQFNRWNISTAHRLQASKQRPDPSIIVRFSSRDYRTAWIRAAREHRKKLTAAELSDTWPSTWVYVNDHLTPYYKAILGRARRMVREKRIAFAWTRECRVFVRRTASPDCPATILDSMDDLDRIIMDK